MEQKNRAAERLPLLLYFRINININININTNTKTKKARAKNGEKKTDHRNAPPPRCGTELSC